MATDDDLTRRLATPPRPPRVPDLFSSNVLFGEAGIYPQGTPMVPAAGPAVDTDGAPVALEAIQVVDVTAQWRAAVALGLLDADEQRR